MRGMALRCAACAVLILGGLGTSACASKERFQRAASEDERSAGDALARAMIDKLGGAAAYDALGFIAFDFIARFGGVEVAAQRHEWDKRNGLHKLITVDGDKTVEVYTDLWDKHVEVYENNKQVTDAARVKELGESAYKSYINDTYWLVAPYKAFDDGVSRAAVEGGVRLSFGDGVGLTSGDVYVFELDKTATLTGFSFLLESGVSASFDFEERLVIEGVTFFKEKSTTGGTIDFGEIVGSAAAPPGTFAPLEAHRAR